MLQVTDSAASVFRDILARDDVDGSAIRLAPTTGEGGQTGIALQAVDGPGSADVATQAEGVDVFIAPELAPALDESILDASKSEEGAEFFLRPQEEGTQ